VRSGGALTKQQFAETNGFNQSRLGRWMDPNSDSPGSFDVRVAARLSVIDDEVSVGAGRSIYWWLAVDVMIDNWPDAKDKAVLERIHGHMQDAL
jgi:hypothetical protein